jgi:hypothetical protein
VGFYIENDSLLVEIANPGEYKGSRFDWTGFIRQVTLKQGSHTFCMAESLIPGQGTGGIGLCNEFGNDLPIGYDETPIGGIFPKIGVGLITRPDSGRYNFMIDQPVEPFPVLIEAGADFVTFISQPVESGGYAVRLEKKITLSDEELTIDYALSNKGTKSIATTEYVHNFLSIDNHFVGPGYELRLAKSVQLKAELDPSKRKVLDIHGNTIGWCKPVEKVFYAVWDGFGSVTPFYWELVHREAGAGVRESGDKPAIRIALWGESHVLSPEVFVDVKIDPGETMRWSRTYTFFTL